MRLHAEIPLISLVDLAYRQVALTLPVLGQRRACKVASTIVPVPTFNPCRAI